MAILTNGQIVGRGLANYYLPDPRGTRDQEICLDCDVYLYGDWKDAYLKIVFLCLGSHDFELDLRYGSC